MSVFCGGFKIGAGLKLIDGVVCDAEATSVDVSKAVTQCGQLWDGSLFVKTVVDGHRVITLHNSEGEEVGKPVFIRANCGVGLDGRFFKMVDGKLTLQDGFVLTVNVTPADATIAVADVDGVSVAPVEGQTNVFLLSGIGDSYTVTVSKDGYTTQTKTVSNTGDQTVTVELVEASGDV